MTDENGTTSEQLYSDHGNGDSKIAKAMKLSGKGIPVHAPKGMEAKKRKAAYQKFNNEKQTLKEVWKAAQTGETKDKGRNWTLSVAVPGSTLNNASTIEMKSYIAGQIARSAAVFCADEVVVFDDKSTDSQIEKPYQEQRKDKDTKHNALLLARILQYCECPQYLRSHFFPLHDDLKYVGLLNPLDAPHHLRENEFSQYREGVVLGDAANGAVVDIGLKRRAIAVDQHPTQGSRVTFMTTQHPNEESDGKKKKEKITMGTLVDRHRPTKKDGIYWGYDVRVANDFSSVFTHSPFEDGYDLLVGIGSDGQPVEKADLPKFRHALVVFTGVKSITKILEEDDKLEVKDPNDLFDTYVSTAPPFNTGHMRVEESMLISLSLLRPKLQSSGFNLVQSITIDEDNVASIPI